MKEEVFDEDNIDDSRLPPLSMAHQKAREPSIVERRTLGVGLEEWGAVAK